MEIEQLQQAKLLPYSARARLEGLRRNLDDYHARIADITQNGVSLDGMTEHALVHLNRLVSLTELEIELLEGKKEQSDD